MAPGDRKSKPIPPIEVRGLCYRIAAELRRDSPRLDEICPRPDDSDLEPVKRELRRTLANDPAWYSTLPVVPGQPEESWRPDSLEFILDDIIADLFIKVYNPAEVWNAVLELRNSGTAVVDYRKPRVEGHVNAGIGEGKAIVRLFRDKLGSAPRPSKAEPKLRLAAHPSVNDPFLIFNGVRFSVKYEIGIFIYELINANRFPVSFSELKRKRPELESTIVTRLFKNIPPGIAALIERHGKGKSYRLKVEELQ